MLRNLRDRMESEKGFTLIELLVVILIIGILAAIALPAFLGQQKKGQDGEAKSNARNLVTHVESCFAESQDYQLCDTNAELGANTGLTVVTAGVGGPGQGEVAVTAVTQDTYTVTAGSKSGNFFSIAKSTAGTSTRGCGSTYVASGAHTGTPTGGCKTSPANTW